MPVRHYDFHRRILFIYLQQKVYVCPNKNFKMARKSSSDSGGFVFKTGLFAVLAGLAFWIFNQFSGKKASSSDDPIVPIERPDGARAG